MVNSSNSINAMIDGSLKSSSMEHGLQYNAIYWETGHRTWISMWAPLTQKFTWKIIDDKVHNFLGSTKPTSSHPFVFYGNSAYFRKYYGDPDLSYTIPLKKSFNFTYTPSGTVGTADYNTNSTFVTREQIFSKIMQSAFKIDFSNYVEQTI